MKDVLKYLTPICLIYLFYQLITPLTFSIAGIKPNLPDILLWTGWHTTILKMFLSSYILMMWADKKLTTNKTNSLYVYVVVATLFHLSILIFGEPNILKFRENHYLLFSAILVIMILMTWTFICSLLSCLCGTTLEEQDREAAEREAIRKEKEREQAAIRREQEATRQYESQNISKNNYSSKYISNSNISYNDSNTNSSSSNNRNEAFERMKKLAQESYVQEFIDVHQRDSGVYYKKVQYKPSARQQTESSLCFTTIQDAVLLSWGPTFIQVRKKDGYDYQFDLRGFLKRMY